MAQVARLRGLGVGALQQVAARDRLEHREVGGVGVVEARQQAVDGAHRAVGLDHKVGPALAGAHAAVRAGGRLERAHHRGAHRDHAAAELAHEVHARGAEGGQPKPFGVRALARLERGHAGVEHERGHVDARGHQAGHELGGEGAAGARHLGAAGRVGVDRLIALERPGAPRNGRSGSARRGAPGSAAAARAGAAQQPQALAAVGRSASTAVAPPGSSSTSPAWPPRWRSAPARSSPSHASPPCSGAGDERCRRSSPWG